MRVSTPDSSVWIRFDAGTGRAEESTPETATHAPVDLVRQLQEQNQVLYEKLRRQIQNKANWRDRALKAQGKGEERQRLGQAVTAESGAEERQRLAEKGEIRPYSGRHYRVLILETDGETDEEALVEAETFARAIAGEQGIQALVGRLWTPDVEWFAEILIPMPTERSMAPQPEKQSSMSEMMRMARMFGGGCKKT